MTKVIILAGGLGTRMSEETENKPKPLVKIGDQPILWHLMNSFSRQGFNEFVIALGYKGETIKAWLRDLQELDGNVNFDFKNRKRTNLSPSRHSNWSVTAVDTGLDSSTSARLATCMDLFPDETLIATYGDGLANVSITKLIAFHEKHERLATVTAVRPPARFGLLKFEHDKVVSFEEKNQIEDGWINGGYFVLNSGVRKFLSDSDISFEYSTLPELSKAGELMAYKHQSFWKPMDTVREKREFEELNRLPIKPWLDVSS
jgi:glucose-1-phosphate cytidylyltransferase